MHLRSKSIGLAIGCLLAVATSPAAAVSFNYDFTSADWGSSDFSLVGNALWANDAPLTPPTRLRLTSAAGGQVGDAWLNTELVDAGQAWNAIFDYQITFEGGGGADGLAFHLHESGTGAHTFFNGAGLSSPFLSVGIDTYDNGGEGGFHLEVYNNGAQVGGNVDLTGLGPIPNDVYRVAMIYDGAGDLAVAVLNTATGNATPVLNYAVDLSALDFATMGWSANTGGSVENHDILNFSGTFAIPEPGTGLMLGAGLMGLGLRRQRRV